MFEVSPQASQPSGTSDPGDTGRAGDSGQPGDTGQPGDPGGPRAADGQGDSGRLSYSKVRALTRIADPGSDADLAEMAAPMTASQLDRFARAHRTVTDADGASTRLRRRLTWRYEDDGSLVLTARLPPEDGAAVLTALRAVLQDTTDSDSHEHEHVHEHGDRVGGASAEASRRGDTVRAASGDAPAEARTGDASAEARTGDAPGQAGTGDAPAEARHGSAPAPDPGPASAEAGQAGDTGTGLPAGASAEAAGAGRAGRLLATSAGLADALTEIAEAYLTHRASRASNPDAYQVIVHADPTALAGQPGGRCHIEDGPAISTAALQQIMCGAVRRWMSHDQHGNVLDVGRHRRDPTPAIRAALRERDNCRCRFPGCHRRATQAHHIRWWLFGGITSLDNMISLCRYHHTLIHQHGYDIAVRGPGVFVFLRPDGKPIPPSPPLPAPTGQITGTHDAEITPDTIVPYWYGERLDLGYAISVLFGNQRVRQMREQKQAATAA